jgi:hypothetical protein
MPTNASDAAREMNLRRWRYDTRGLADIVGKLIRRAPALTPEQRNALRAALDAAEDAE